MGLDLVEVFMEIEDTFQFQLHGFTMNSALMPYDLISVDDVCEEIWQRLQGCEPDWTEADVEQFHERIVPLRKETTAYLSSLPKAWFYWMSSRLDRLIAAEYRDQAWTEIERIWGCPLPPLERDSQHEPPRIPISCETVPRMIGVIARRWISQNDPNRFVWRLSGKPRPPNAEKWTRELVWDKLKEILMEYLNLTANDVQPEATLIGDLKMD